MKSSLNAMLQNTKKTYRIAVIGGGASGLFAAAVAAKEAASCDMPVSVAVYEGNARVGKKILVTGNGRCNLTNERMGEEYYRGSPALFRAIYAQVDREAVLSIFEDAGLYVRADQAGRVYPMSNQASSVLDALRNVCAERGVEEVTACKIVELKRHGDGFLLNGTYCCDKAIIACGGRAAPVHGADGGGFTLLKSFGISVTPLFPALTPLCVKDFTKALKGVRAVGALTLKSAGKTLAQAAGEIQYTDYGLSGIPAMQVSRFAAQRLAEGGEVFAVVDSAPYFSAQELQDKLFSIGKAHPALTTEAALAGFLPKRLGTVLAASCSVSPEKKIGALHENVLEKITAAVKCAKYPVSAVRGFADAQVTAGGVAEEEINASTMELRRAKGLYVCGEIVDVDGDCGGYNLQWAFSSGAVAGRSAVRSLAGREP